MQLFDSQAVDGSSPWVAAVPDAYNGLINVYVSGTLGGGTVTLEAMAPDGVTAVPVRDGEFLTADVRTISAASMSVRATLTGSTAPNVSVWVEVESVTLRSEVRGRV